MTLALSVADNGDGTAAATVSGSLGASVGVYYAPWSVLTGLAPWQTGGTIVGDGTLAVSAGVGSYWWYAGTTSTLTPPLPQVLVDPRQSVHYRCLTAVQSRIQALELSGIASSSILAEWLPRVWDQVDSSALPLILISPPGRETQPDVLTGVDDIGYPVLVCMADRQNKSYSANLARNTLWRQQIFRALRHQRLAGVPEIITIDVEPGPIIDLAAFKSNYFWSTLLLRCRSRETRGV